MGCPCLDSVAGFPGELWAPLIAVFGSVGLGLAKRIVFLRARGASRLQLQLHEAGFTPAAPNPTRTALAARILAASIFVDREQERDPKAA